MVNGINPEIEQLKEKLYDIDTKRLGEIAKLKGELAELKAENERLKGEIINGDRVITTLSDALTRETNAKDDAIAAIARVCDAAYVFMDAVRHVHAGPSSVWPSVQQLQLVEATTAARNLAIRSQAAKGNA